MAFKATKCKIVALDVGGTLYKVSRDTLERCEGSMLASLISDHRKEGNSDNKEPIFIDRNGRLFEYVLDYLRASEVYLPSSVSLDALKKEFVFYGIAADMSKVIAKQGIEYCHSLKAQAFALDMEICASRISAQAEYKFWASDQNVSTLSVYIQSDDCEVLHKHEHILRERLLDRGMHLVASNSSKGHIDVSRASTVRNDR